MLLQLPAVSSACYTEPYQKIKESGGVRSKFCCLGVHVIQYEGRLQLVHLLGLPFVAVLHKFEDSHHHDQKALPSQVWNKSAILWQWYRPRL